VKPAKPRHPHEFCDDWPDLPCSDPIAEVARQVALRLRDALDGVSLREARDLTGVDHTSIADVVSGQAWPTLKTLARLEAGLGVDLWPGRLGVVGG
jgi:hypothetical protein